MRRILASATNAVIWTGLYFNCDRRHLIMWEKQMLSIFYAIWEITNEQGGLFIERVVFSYIAFKWTPFAYLNSVYYSVNSYIYDICVQIRLYYNPSNVAVNRVMILCWNTSTVESLITTEQQHHMKCRFMRYVDSRSYHNVQLCGVLIVQFWCYICIFLHNFYFKGILSRKMFEFNNTPLYWDLS